MKAFRTLAAILFIAWLTGCAALPFTDEAQARELMSALTQFYQTDALVRAGGVETRTRIHRPGPDATRVEVLAPESLAGFEYIFRQGGVELSYRGLVFNLETFGGALTLPVVRGVGALSGLLLPEGDRPLPTQQPDGLWLLRGQFAGEESRLFLDGESGAPVKLLLPGSEVEIVFENFIFSG